jgi:hypothetical protein
VGEHETESEFWFWLGLDLGLGSNWRGSICHGIDQLGYLRKDQFEIAFETNRYIHKLLIFNTKSFDKQQN